MVELIKRRNNETDFIAVMENALKRAEINYNYKDIDNVRIFFLAFTANRLLHIELKLIVEPNGDVMDCICIAKNIEKNKQLKVLSLLNQLNGRYRFAKFVLDDDNDLCIYREDKLQDTSDDWCDRMISYVATLIKIADESSPEILKLVWSDNSDETE